MLLNDRHQLREVMKNRWNTVSRGVLGERGATLVEYSLLIALIAAVAIAAINTFGASVSQDFSEINSQILDATS